MTILAFNKRLDKLEAIQEKGVIRVLSFINDPLDEGFEAVQDALVDAGIVSRPNDFHIITKICDPKAVVRDDGAKMDSYRLHEVSDPLQGATA